MINSVFYDPELIWDELVQTFYCIFSASPDQPYHPYHHWWNGEQWHWKWIFPLEGCSIAKLEVTGVVSQHLPGGGGVGGSTGTAPALCLVTYIVDPEVSTGPVVLLFLWNHLHSDVSVGYRFFREWPVMVTFHLERGQNNCLKQTG